MQAGANEMEEGISSMPEVPSDPINAVSAAVDQLCAGSQKVKCRNNFCSFCTFHSGKRNEEFSKSSSGS